MRKALTIFSIICLSMGAFANSSNNPSDTIPPVPTYKIKSTAVYKGDPMEWKLFLANNIQGDVPFKNNAPEGSYTAKVRFIINTDGTIDRINVIQDPGFGAAEELVRVIKLSSGNWQPLITEDGQKVKSMLLQPLMFKVEGKQKIAKK